MATYTPKSMADLERFVINQQIEKTIELANEKLNDIVLECFKDHMDDDFYNLYRARIYPRSYGLRESLGVKLKPIRSGNSVTFGVWLNPQNLETNYWENKGCEGIRYSENGYDVESITETILSGNFDENRKKDILEEVKRDINTLENIKSSLKDMFIKNGFIVKG